MQCSDLPGASDLLPSEAIKHASGHISRPGAYILKTKQFIAKVANYAPVRNRIPASRRASF